MSIKIKTVNGVTTITSKSVKMSIGFINRGRMVEIAIANCCPTDKFSRKAGRQMVYDRLEQTFENKSTIFLPLGNYSNKDISEILTDTFLLNFYF